VVAFKSGESRALQSAGAAAPAAARHKTSLVAWDKAGAGASDDLLELRPLGETL
jgi:hypothetical protein